MSGRDKESIASGAQGMPVGCPVSDVFYLFGKPFLMDVLYVLLRTHDRPIRFVDIQAEVNTTPGTLSERLKDLVAAGLITRTAYPEIPPRVEYALTTKALRLRSVFDEIATWARSETLPPAPPERALGMQA